MKCNKTENPSNDALDQSKTVQNAKLCKVQNFIA